MSQCKDIPQLTCPCRSVLSSIRAQVSVWIPSKSQTVACSVWGSPSFPPQLPTCLLIAPAWRPWRRGEASHWPASPQGQRLPTTLQCRSHWPASWQDRHLSQKQPECLGSAPAPMPACYHQIHLEPQTQQWLWVLDCVPDLACVSFNKGPCFSASGTQAHPKDRSCP